MRMIMLTVAMFLGGIVLPAGSARAEWLEASNKHFIIYGNVPQRKMARFADQLERYGSAIRALFGLPEPDGGMANRVTIYLVSGTGAVGRYFGASGGNVAGYYVSRASGSFIVTPANIDEGNEAFNADLVLFHEYAHHLLLGNSSAIYPGWMSEGYAELLSTAIIDGKGDVTFGAANNARAYSILADQPMAVKDLLDSDNRKLDAFGTDQKYARGWLLTHYLLLGNKRNGQAATFLKLISSGLPSVEAGAKAFGDLRKLDAEVDSYRTKRLRGLIVHSADIAVDPVTIRPLDPGEALIMPLRLESATGVNETEAKKLIPKARTIAAAYPASAWIQRAVAEMEYDAGNDAEAEAASDRAIAAMPNDLTAMIYKARVHLRRAAAKPDDIALWRAARGWIVKANRIEPDHALPLLLYYQSFLMARQTPSRSAVDGLLRAVELAPQDGRARALAFNAMLEGGDLPAARRILAPLAYQPHRDSKAANPARAMLALIDSGADLATVRAAAIKAGSAAGAGE